MRRAAASRSSCARKAIWPRAHRSRSGKLIHGGLRYLEYYEFRLVREALIEREVLLRAAPHIVWPMRFVLPHSPEQRPAWLVRLGLFLYDHLGGRETLAGLPRASISNRDPEGAVIKENSSSPSNIPIAGSTMPASSSSMRSTPSERGAEILTRTGRISARREDGLWQVESQRWRKARRAKARVLVNAAGPWVQDVISRVVGVNSARRVRLVKGSHIVVPKFWEGPHAYLFQNHDKRVIFVNPYRGDLCLIGTTDIPYEGRAEDVAIDDDEIDYLLAAVNRYMQACS